MDNVRTLVKNSFDYYDKDYYKYEDMQDRVAYIKFEQAEHDLENNQIFLYDMNHKLVLKSGYEVVGAFYPEHKVWVWGWAIPSINTNSTRIIKRLFDYGIQLAPSPENIFLKTELVTSRFIISSDIQLQIHSALASYLAKKPFIFRYGIDYDFLQTNNTGSGDMYPINQNFEKAAIVYYIFILDKPAVTN